MKRATRFKWAVGIAIAGVLLLAVCYLCRGQFTASPFSTTYTFDGPSGVYPGASGRVYVIDQGKTSVLITDGAGTLLGTIPGGADSDTHPYYASLVEEGSDGSIYLADVRYSGQGTRISQERIFRYDASGENPTCVYLLDYSESGSYPMQYGNIQSLQELDGRLVFTLKTGEGLAVCSLDPDTGALERQDYPLPGQYFSDSAVDPETLRPVFTNRLGQVCGVDANGQVQVYLDEGRTSWMLCTQPGEVYYTDMAANEVLRYDLATGAQESILTAGDILYAVEVQDGRVYATDYIGYYVLEDGAVEYVDTLAYSQPAMRSALWAALILGGVLVALSVCLLLGYIVVKNHRSVLFQRILIVLVVSLSISIMVSYITISRMVQNQNDVVMEQMNLFADILTDETDLEAFQRIDSIDDYRNEDYLKVKEPLDRLTDKTYDNDLNYYYILYTHDEGTIYVVMDYEETAVTRHPVYAWGEPGYTDVFTSGQPVEFVADLSSYGAWSFVLKPVFDEAGNVGAVLEVGANFDSQAQQNRDLAMDVAMTVVSMTVVLLMFIIEAIIYAEYQDKKSRSAAGGIPTTLRFPLRAMAFLAFLADCMQDPFVSILANDLYEPLFGIPQSVGAALPLSAQVLFAALSAFVCGSVVRRAGVRRMLSCGFLMEIAGFLTCGISGQYLGLLVGKSVIGIGAGAILVSLNSVAASGADEEETSAAFTAVNAGTLSGITVGAGIGSIILGLSNFSTVYYAGAAFLAVGLLLALFGEDYHEPVQARERGSITVFRFLASRRVWSFLLLMLVPFLMAISYREYFFPLYAAEMGIAEADIGQIYLLCGLLVIYLGPVLTKTLIGLLGGKWTTVVASGLMIIATLLFAFVPTMPAALIGVLLLSVAISFGYAAQSSYYAGIPQIQQYGSSRAMGVYSLFDNSGQTLGPVVYGVALMFGYQRGILVIGAALLALLVLFLIVNLGGQKVPSNTKEETSHAAL